MKPYYQDEAVTLYHGDAREILPQLTEPVDLVLTDPPYGNNTPYASYEDSPDSLTALIRDVWPSIYAAAPRCLVTCGVSNVHKWPAPDWILCWFTPAGAGSGPWGFCCWQPVLAYGSDPYLAAGMGRRPDGRNLTQSSETNGHPCPKPIGIMRWLVDRGSLPGETILDPFCGSGTTLRAAKDLGRKAIGIEISEAYCRIAVQRLSQSVLPLGLEEVKQRECASQLPMLGSMASSTNGEEVP